MSKHGNFHEEYGRPELPLPSDRSTGFVFAIVAAIVAFWWRSNEGVLWAALGISGFFVGVSLLAPIVVRPLNILWMKFGLLLSKFMNPIVMLLLFLIAIIPTGLLMQLFYDPLRRKRQPNADSYWIVRSSNHASSMSNQF